MLYTYQLSALDGAETFNQSNREKFSKLSIKSFRRFNMFWQ